MSNLTASNNVSRAYFLMLRGSRYFCNRGDYRVRYIRAAVVVSAWSLSSCKVEEISGQLIRRCVGRYLVYGDT